jgi:hypothetical protein
MLKKWLAIFAEHYRQPITELSALAYQVGMADLDLSPEDIDAGCQSALKMAEFMPTVSMIRRECTFQRAERIGIREESAKFQQTWADLHARGLEYAKSIKEKSMPLPEPKLRPENRPVIATRERLEKLARQAEQIKQTPKYQRNDAVLKMASALASVGQLEKH